MLRPILFDIAQGANESLQLRIGHKVSCISFGLMLMGAAVPPSGLCPPHRRIHSPPHENYARTFLGFAIRPSIVFG